MKAELAALRPPRFPRALWRRTVNLHASLVIQVTAPALPAPPRQPLAAAAAEMVLASLKQRWQKEAVKKADLVSAVQGSWAPGWVPGGGAAAGGGALATATAVHGHSCLSSQVQQPRLVNKSHSCQRQSAAAASQHCCSDLAAGCHHPIDRSPLTAHPLPPSSAPLQQLLKAVAFFAGAIVLSRNFGDAFAI